METILKKDKLGQWVAELGGSAQVFAPAFADDVWSYQPVAAGAELRLDHTNPVRPPKGFALPQREVLYRFRQEPGQAPQLTPTLPQPKPAVVLGVRPCDGRAMVRNDTVFGCGVADPYYQARRESLTLVGLACATPPSPNCFCQSLGGSPQSEDGLDALMTELDGRYHIKALTPKGEALLSGGLFDTVSAADGKQVAAAHAAASAQPQRAIRNLDRVADGLKANFDSPEWSTLAQACIGCGICTYLCPSCHCFDINDEVTGQSPLAGERVRTWDNCQFPDFTMHSSGHNPRENTGARLRQRVLHKFLYFVENHKTQMCTGCGRCITHCPVGIDIVRVVGEVAQS